MNKYIEDLIYVIPNKFIELLDDRNFISYKSEIDLLFKLWKIEGTDNVFYVRDVFNYYNLHLINIIKKKFTIVYDFRSLIHTEMNYKKKSIYKQYLLKYMESYAYRKADYIQCVSNNLLKYLHDNFDYRDAVVIPCFVNGVKKLSNKTVDSFVYCGGLSEWQKFDLILDLYFHIFCEYKEVNKKSCFTIITMQKDDAWKIINAKYKVNKDFTETIKIKTMHPNDIPSELTKYQYGFLFRDKHIMNETSCPIKLCEYLSSGVIPIMSSGIGDFSNTLDFAVYYNKDKVGLTKKLLLDNMRTPELSIAANSYFNDFLLPSKNIKKSPIFYLKKNKE
jgi:hypothetical protein